MGKQKFWKEKGGSGLEDGGEPGRCRLTVLIRGTAPGAQGAEGTAWHWVRGTTENSRPRGEMVLVFESGRVRAGHLVRAMLMGRF